MPRIIICIECKQHAPLHAHGLCDRCYLKRYRKRDGYAAQRLEYDVKYMLSHDTPPTPCKHYCLDVAPTVTNLLLINDAHICPERR